MAITAKEITIILLGIIGSVLVGLLININIKFTDQLKDNITIFLIIVITVSVIIFILYRKFGEVDRELENQKLEQKRLNEKLKIYDRLSKIEKRIFEEDGDKS